MSYEDWLRNFDTCQICNLTPETVGEDLTEKDWENARFLSVIYKIKGFWVFYKNEFFTKKEHFLYVAVSVDRG